MIQNRWKFQEREVGVKMSTIVVFSMFVTSFMPLWISILIIEFLGICDVNNSNKITEIVCVSVIVLLNLMSFLNI